MQVGHGAVAVVENTQAVRVVSGMHKNAYAHPVSLPKGRVEAPSPLSSIANESKSNELPTQILQEIADPRTQHTD